jgi:hypothetical protein
VLTASTSRDREFRRSAGEPEDAFKVLKTGKEMNKNKSQEQTRGGVN